MVFFLLRDGKEKKKKLTFSLFQKQNQKTEEASATPTPPSPPTRRARSDSWYARKRKTTSLPETPLCRRGLRPQRPTPAAWSEGRSSITRRPYTRPRSRCRRLPRRSSGRRWPGSEMGRRRKERANIERLFLMFFAVFVFSFGFPYRFLSEFFV